MLYYIILFFLLILSVRYDINGKTKYREQWYNVVLIILILIAGLRFRLGEDTINYLFHFYHGTPKLWDINVDTFLASGQSPLWILLNSIVKSLGGKFFIVQLIQAAIVNILIFKYFKKHSSYPFACVALYFFWRYQWYSMIVMKAAIALSIILFANDYFLEKKYKKGFLLILIATGFHLSSILLVIIPFLTFIRFNILGVVLLVFSFFVGAFLQSQLGDIFELMEFAEGVSNKLNNYLDSKYMTQTHNLNYFIVKVFPIIMYPIASLLYIKNKCKGSHILRLEPFLMVGLLFQMMQFSINIFYRYVYIFTIYYIIFIVHFFIEYSKKSFMLERSLAYVRTFMVVLPFWASLVFLYPMTHISLYPYSSVIERSINQKREKYFVSVKEDLYNLNLDEY